MILIDSPRGNSFVGCSGYPECKTTYSLPKGATVLKATCEECGLPMISFGKPRQRACLDPKCGKDGREPTNEVVGKCPECGSDLIKRSGRYGEFIGCTGFPKCRFTMSVDQDIKTAAKSTGSTKKTTAKKTTSKTKKSTKKTASKSTKKKSSSRKTKRKSSTKNRNINKKA